MNTYTRTVYDGDDVLHFIFPVFWRFGNCIHVCWIRRVELEYKTTTSASLCEDDDSGDCDDNNSSGSNNHHRYICMKMNDRQSRIHVHMRVLHLNSILNWSREVCIWNRFRLAIKVAKKTKRVWERDREYGGRFACGLSLCRDFYFSFLLIFAIQSVSHSSQSEYVARSHHITRACSSCFCFEKNIYSTDFDRVHANRSRNEIRFWLCFCMCSRCHSHICGKIPFCFDDKRSRERKKIVASGAFYRVLVANLPSMCDIHFVHCDLWEDDLRVCLRVDTLYCLLVYVWLGWLRR